MTNRSLQTRESDDSLEAFTDQERAFIEASRVTAKMTDQELVQTFRQQMQMLVDLTETVNSGMNALYKLFIHLTAVQAAATVGTDANLKKFLAEFPNKLFNDVQRASLEGSTLQRIADDQPFVSLNGDDLDMSVLPQLTGQYIDGIQSLLSTGRGDHLREIVKRSKIDFAELMNQMQRQGRMRGLDPLTRKLGELANEVYMADKEGGWPQIAARAMAQLQVIKKRSTDEADMLAWFNKIGPQDNDKQQRANRGRQFRKKWEKWKNASA